MVCAPLDAIAPKFEDKRQTPQPVVRNTLL